MKENTATIKFGKGYEAPWLVLSGSVADMRKELADAFGWDISAVVGLSFVEMIAKASRESQAAYSVTVDLGGNVETSRTVTAKTAAPVEAAPAAEEGDADSAVKEALEAVSDETELKKVWLQYGEQIANSKPLQEIYKAARERAAGK